MFNKDIFRRCFPYKGKHFYYNVTGIIPYFKSIHFLLKNGYDESAVWDLDWYFIRTTRSALKQYLLTHISCPVLVENYPYNGAETEEEKRIEEENEDKWNGIISHMIELLDKMDECNEMYEDLDYGLKFKSMNTAKVEFFKLFSEYFYHLWD